MKCKISYRTFECSYFDKDEGCTKTAGDEPDITAVLHEYYGEILSYEAELHDEGERYVTVAISKNKKLELYESRADLWCGVCPTFFTVIDYIEIDGKVIIEDKQDEEDAE